MLYVVIDPAAVYRAAISPALLSNAHVVVDHLHLVKLANDMLTAMRRRVTWERRNRRGRKVDPEWANRRRLLTGRERLRPNAYAAMWNELLANDPTGQILAAWIAKEELRALMRCAREHAAPHVIRQRPGDFYSWCATTIVPEIHRLASTIETWWQQTLRFLQAGLTTRGPRASIARSRTWDAEPAGSATRPITAVEYGWSALGTSAERQRRTGSRPVNREDPGPAVR